MLRITTHHTADLLTFQLEGRLVGPWVTELNDCCRTTLSNYKHPVRIDLREVTFVDGDGKQLLAELHRQGAELLASGCQMNAIVAEIENAPVNSNRKERDNHGK
jgi:hypothetical protein